MTDPPLRQVELPKTKGDRITVDGKTITIVIDGDNFAALFGALQQYPAVTSLLAWARAEATTGTQVAGGPELRELLQAAAKSPPFKPQSLKALRQRPRDRARNLISQLYQPL